LSVRLTRRSAHADCGAAQRAEQPTLQ
jgi:hypothetical protein